MSIDAYPLAWPPGWPRTVAHERKHGLFGTKERSGQWPRHNGVTVYQGVRRILDQLGAFDGPQSYWKRIDPEQVVISTNMRVRKTDGGIAADQRKPEDPGVAVYFVLDGKRQCVPCDSYTDVAQNLAAVAATLAALRTLERHGSGLMERAFTGFLALPDLRPESWWVVLGVVENASASDVRAAFVKARSLAHPDKGGSDDLYYRVTQAWERYLESRE